VTLKGAIIQRMARVPACHPDRKHKAKGMCFNCYDKWLYRKDPKARAVKHRSWSQKNKDHLQSYQIAWRQANPVCYALMRIKANARKRGIPFDLTESDLRAVWTEVCPVFGISLVMNSERKNNSLSVDRIDNSVGYVRGNVCVMSWRANKLKADASLKELETLVTYMRSLQSLKK
jgi:hypothetical protein